jgi:hypothetical protein
MIFMKMIIPVVMGMFSGVFLVGCGSCPCNRSDAARWSVEKANQWYSQQPWLIGCNFIPSTAVNQLEMWQADTFDPQTIDRELGWAHNIGFNVVRVYLHDLAWQSDPDGFKVRLDEFLAIADHHHIRAILVIFDDCWNDNAKIGKQPDPIPGVHNSGWLKSPTTDILNDPTRWDYLENYVTDILRRFGRDNRVLMWDLYNEPGNSRKLYEKTLPLLKQTFCWAWRVNPDQPITAGVYTYDEKYKLTNEFLLAVSDVITFHDYNEAKDLENTIRRLKPYGRPLICTEWLRRPVSTIIENLEIFKHEKVGCLNWGLVSGKTQTIYPWKSKPGSSKPEIWFHDIFRPDGSPFNPAEIELFKKLTMKN